MSLPSSLVIALVSGKGGVGKTMLSVAVAKELSLSNRTLIVDLDFFNRGLTGLMGRGDLISEIDKPAFLMDGQQETAAKWRIVQVAENLFHIAYPDLLPEEMQRFETLDVNVLKDSLQAFIQEASEKCQCGCVVLDCHGGPDNSSFAACLLSDYSLMVSEPDRITFYGTLNFLRQLKRIGGEQQTNLHLVFNKVVPAFSGLFLRSLYNRLVREYFSDRPLLGIFPLEIYLTKEFEKTPFLTGVYPYSWLAKKTRTLLCDLLLGDHQDKLPGSVRASPRWMRAYTRLALGRQLPPFNMNVVMLAIVAVVVFLALSALTLFQFYPKGRQNFQREVSKMDILQCLHKSEVVMKDNDMVDEMIATPSRYSPLLSKLYLDELYDLRDRRMVYLREDFYFQSRSRENLKQLLEQERNFLDVRLDHLHEISSFRKCAYPNLNFSDLEDFEERALSERSMDIEYGIFSGRAVRDYGLPSPRISSDPSPFIIFVKRREVLNTLKPKLVPERYLGAYYKSVQNVTNIGLFYLALQTVSEVAFSPSGSKTIAIAGAGWLSLVLLLMWSGQLDRRFTYYSRLRRFGSLFAPYVGAFVLWFFPLLGGAVLVRAMVSKIRANPSNRLGRIEIALLLLVPLMLGIGQMMRAYKNLRYEGNYLEGLLRAGFLTYLTLGSIALYFLFMR